MATSEELYFAARTVRACQEDMSLTTQITAARSVTVVRGGALEGEVDEYLALAEALHAAAASGLGSAAEELDRAADEALEDELAKAAEGEPTPTPTPTTIGGYS